MKKNFIIIILLWFLNSNLMAVDGRLVLDEAIKKITHTGSYSSTIEIIQYENNIVVKKYEGRVYEYFMEDSYIFYYSIDIPENPKIFFNYMNYDGIERTLMQYDDKISEVKIEELNTEIFNNNSYQDFILDIFNNGEIVGVDEEEFRYNIKVIPKYKLMYDFLEYSINKNTNLINSVIYYKNEAIVREFYIISYENILDDHLSITSYNVIDRSSDKVLMFKKGGISFRSTPPKYFQKIKATLLKTYEEYAVFYRNKMSNETLQ
jgi:hypothetical protein